MGKIVAAMNAAYLDYLRSPHWRNLRASLFRIYGFHCACCGSNVLVDAHHLIYRTPLESCSVRDLMPLCRGCHEIVHADDRIKAALRAEPSIKQRWGIVVRLLRDLHGIRHPESERRWGKKRGLKVELNATVLRPQRRPKRWIDLSEFEAMKARCQ